MKTYKRNELKDIFQKELKSITVSDKLKNKTLDNIKKQHTAPIYWLRNCAAILLVSCICLSLYLHQNSFFEKKAITPEAGTQDIKLDQEETNFQKSSLEEKKMRSSLPKETQPLPQQKNISTGTYETSNTENSIMKYGLGNTLSDYSQCSDSVSFSSSAIVENSTSEDSTKEIKIGDTEEMLLQYYPDIEKVEQTYRFITENEIIIYHVENCIITNISITPNN